MQRHASMRILFIRGGLALAGYVQGANKGSAFEATGADGKTLHPNKARFIVALSKTL
jgi:hypothetical protein